jgi:hypothetical protein
MDLAKDGSDLNFFRVAFASAFENRIQQLMFWPPIG